MATKLMRTAQLKQVVKDLKLAGYNVVNDDDNYTVEFDGENVFRAMQHSSGVVYLVKYNDMLLTPEEA